MVTAAFYTFFIQAFLLPVALVLITWYIVKMIMTPAKYRDQKKEKKKKTIFAGNQIPALKPLTCKNCGGSISLRQNDRVCRYCSAPVTIPPEYATIGIMRKEMARRLEKAQLYWRWAGFYTSRLLRWIIRLTYLWILTAFIIICFQEDVFLEKLSHFVDPNNEDLVESLLILGLCTTIIWVVLLMATVGGISRKARKFLPVLIPEHTGVEEKVSCGTCGNQLHFNKGDLLQLCDYCGVETYRARLAKETSNTVNTNSRLAGFSLVEAMAAYSDAVEEMLMTPAMLVFILLILPFFMIVLPKLLWAFITEHVLPVMIFTAVVAAVVYLIYRIRKNRLTTVPKQA